MPPKQKFRFTDNTAEARFLKSLFDSGSVCSSDKPSDVKARYSNRFGHIATKPFWDKFNKFATEHAEGKHLLFCL